MRNDFGVLARVSSFGNRIDFKVGPDSDRLGFIGSERSTQASHLLISIGHLLSIQAFLFLDSLALDRCYMDFAFYFQVTICCMVSQGPRWILDCSSGPFQKRLEANCTVTFYSHSQTGKTALDLLETLSESLGSLHGVHSVLLEGLWLYIGLSPAVCTAATEPWHIFRPALA